MATGDVALSLRAACDATHPLVAAPGGA